MHRAFHANSRAPLRMATHGIEGAQLRSQTFNIHEGRQEVHLKTHSFDLPAMGLNGVMYILSGHVKLSTVLLHPVGMRCRLHLLAIGAECTSLMTRLAIGSPESSRPFQEITLSSQQTLFDVAMTMPLPRRFFKLVPTPHTLHHVHTACFFGLPQIRF